MNNPRAKLIAIFAIAVVVFVVVLRSRREPTFETPGEMRLQKFFPADARKVFENASAWTLFSLDPQMRDFSQASFHAESGIQRHETGVSGLAVTNRGLDRTRG